MHLFTEYALSTGSKIKRPELIEKFFPVTSKKYITCQVKSAMVAKDYEYFQEVIDLIKPILNINNIHIVQLGTKDETALVNVINLCGQTNLAQSTYIIKRGLMHFGIDSALIHIASVLDKPLVSIYSVSPPSVCGPYFNYKSKSICLEPKFPEGYKYSYNPNEQPKMVNSVEPEAIVKAILELLQLDQTISHESLWIGKDYKKSMLEVIPNQVIDPRNFQNSIFNIRADLLFNENSIYGNLQVRPCVVVTNQPLNIDILKQFKNNIKNILYLLDIKNISIDFPFIKQLNESSLPYILLTYDENSLNELRFNYIDFNPVLHCKLSKKSDLKNLEKISSETCFKTNKLILSDGKIYISRAHYEAGLVYDPALPNKIIDNDRFFEELDYMYIFNL